MSSIPTPPSSLPEKPPPTSPAANPPPTFSRPMFHDLPVTPPLTASPAISPVLAGVILPSTPSVPTSPIPSVVNPSPTTLSPTPQTFSPATPLRTATFSPTAPRTPSVPKPPPRAQRIPVTTNRLTFTDPSSPSGRLRNVVDFKILPGLRFGMKRDVYEYTSIEADEIRLLALDFGKKEDPIVCTLKARKLRDVKGGYEALSYYWGPLKQPTNEIRVQCLDATGTSNRSKLFYVGDNLFAALKALRREDTEMLLWIDAICMNQESHPEKTVQLAKMDEIYSSAAHVTIWLGESDQGSDSTIGFFIPKILDLRQFDKLVRDQSMAIHWKRLADLMTRTWFSRRWVVQEVALPKDAYIKCGDLGIHWDDFAIAVDLFVEKFSEIKDLFENSADFKYNRHAIKDIEALGACKLISAIRNLFRRSNDGEIREYLMNLESLVSTLQFFDATEPCDIIYSLLSIASDTRNSDQGVRADYNKDPMEVFIDFVKFSVESSGSMDVICRHWAPVLSPKQSNMNRPSWIPDIQDGPYGSSRDTLEGRQNGDSLVGPPNRSFYNASKGSKAQARFGEQPQPSDLGVAPGHQHTPASTSSSETSNRKPLKYDGSLHVRGFQLAKVKILKAPVAYTVIHAEVLRMAGWNWDWDPASTPTEVDERLWRTLVADRDPVGNNPPGWYHRACLYCLTDNTVTNLRGNLQLLHPRAKHDSDIVQRYLERAANVTWNRRFLLAGEQSELFGLAPQQSREGDVICILFGCSVPVILRRRVEFDGHEWFEFVGEAYVHGKMDGLSDAEMESQTQWFELR
ncbi:HET-domain-containing protein [Aulographum hederae CBS 113979]|uniref:HET-domain-containing protein n=1 Tax=Aulographum hederae CBS 113979 TaxID=1176131 RepID=A0A6G1H786_9PEZI|nr:HET-domain-containing protein [Aulographum hederae CBS 113979]